jgi:hypothetical protein
MELARMKVTIAAIIVGMLTCVSLEARAQSHRASGSSRDYAQAAGKQVVAKRRIALSSLNLDLMEQGFGRPGVNVTMDGVPLRIAGKSFDSGVATHAESTFTVALDGKAVRFRALCGVDDDSLGSPASVRFHVIGDGKTLWSSPLMKPGMPAVPADVRLAGIKRLALKVDDGGDGIRSDHADWAAAAIYCNGALPLATNNQSAAIAGRKLVKFALELYYIKDQDRSLAQGEAKKMVALLAEIAPHIELTIKVLKSTSPIRSKFESGGWHDVPNQPPADTSAQSLLITEEDIGASGWAGPGMGCLSKQQLLNKAEKGANSADISLHEWMHTLYGKRINGRELGWLHDNPRYGFPNPDYIDKAGDGVWRKWYKYYLRWN